MMHWCISNFIIIFSFSIHLVSCQTTTEKIKPLPMQCSQEFPYNITLVDTAGQSFNSFAILKKSKNPTVLLFWMTTCGPCRMELNAISKKFNSWKEETKFNFYAISLDFPDRFEQFVARVKESSWPFPAYFDQSRSFSSIMPGELNGLPQLFVIDKNGKIVYHTRRYRIGDEDKLFEVLRSM